MEKNILYVVSVEDTKRYGIIKAAIIGRIRWWCEYNKDKKVKDRFYNNEWWSGFMSSKTFSEQLGMSERTIEKHLAALIKTGIIIKGNFNKKQYDRTSWYRVNPFTPIEYSIYANSVNGNTLMEEMDVPDEGTPIPVKHSVIKNVGHSVITPVNPSVEEQLNYKYIRYDKLQDEWVFEQLTKLQKEKLTSTDVVIYENELDVYNKKYLKYEQSN